MYFFLFCFFFFFFNDTATTEIYTLSLHDALPILPGTGDRGPRRRRPNAQHRPRSEEHTSELQSQFHLVCRLLLEKKKQTRIKRVDCEKKKKRRQLRRPQPSS